MHMKTVEDLLMQMEEHSSYRIDIHPPADAKAISEMKKTIRLFLHRFLISTELQTVSRLVCREQRFIL